MFIVNFCDINGLLYGKRSKTLRKSGNDKLDPDLCFSLILKTRTWDLECTSENISKWMLVFINEIKKYNSKYL